MTASAREPLPVTYVLPLRWDGPGPIGELADYLSGLARSCDEVIVVDGSPEPEFVRHSRAFPEGVRHMRVGEVTCANGKVGGVIAGVRRARNEAVVIADDDVRYEPSNLEAVTAQLAEADLVRPQNHFDPRPWHARLDTARSLLNRIWTGDGLFPVGDFPGTFALRKSSFIKSGAYDGDVLFENLELMRTLAAARGRVRTDLGLYVRRLPPTTRHFLSQRVPRHTTTSRFHPGSPHTSRSCPSLRC